MSTIVLSLSLTGMAEFLKEGTYHGSMFKRGSSVYVVLSNQKGSGISLAGSTGISPGDLTITQLFLAQVAKDLDLLEQETVNVEPA